MPLGTRLGTNACRDETGSMGDEKLEGTLRRRLRVFADNTPPAPTTIQAHEAPTDRYRMSKRWRRPGVNVWRRSSGKGDPYSRELWLNKLTSDSRKGHGPRPADVTLAEL
ncbi:unnamed protein product [Pylaiella littoralis]